MSKVGESTGERQRVSGRMTGDDCGMVREDGWGGEKISHAPERMPRSCWWSVCSGSCTCGDVAGGLAALARVRVCAVVCVE